MTPPLPSSFTRCTLSSIKSATSPEVQIVEVGPRDGLQNEATHVSVADKIRWIELLVQAGCTHIEAGSFVSPRWVPQMADSAQVLEGVHRPAGVCLSALVPNAQGWERALRSKNVNEIAIFVSASETFSHRNAGGSRADVWDRLQPVVAHALSQHMPVRAYVSCAVACPYEGPVAPAQVAALAHALLDDWGCYQVSLGDTVGVATPAATRRLLHDCASFSSNLAVHFHDTYGQGLANVLVALEEFGIRTVDASTAGLGGCPYAPGASGNVATEDVVYMLNGLGVETGIDLDRLVEAAEFIRPKVASGSRSRTGTALAAKRRNS